MFDPIHSAFVMIAPTPPQQNWNQGEGEIACRCLGVSESTVRAAIEIYEVRDLRELGRCTGAGQGCNSCHVRLKQILRSAGSCVASQG